MSDNHMENSQAGNSTNTVWQIVGRLITAGIVLAITAFFTPGFEISNFGSLAIATIVLTVIDFLIIAICIFSVIRIFERVKNRNKKVISFKKWIL